MKRTNVSLVLGLVMLFLNASLNVQAQSWSLTGSMETARGNLTATLLNNGQVLVAGGRLRGNYNLNTAELYNPSTGTFTPTGHLNAGRNAHAATLLPNGEVLIVGGQDIVNSQINCLSSAELYNPTTGQFTFTGSLNTARCLPTATLLNNGKVLITDGATAELYDPSTGTFSLTGSLNNSRAVHTSTLLANGKVLIAGGQGTSGAYLANAELYDPATGSFTATGSMHTARAFLSATLLGNGKVLIAGGQGSAPNYPILGSAELYNPATGKFTLTSSLNTPRCFQTSLLLPSGKALVAAGIAFRVTTTSAELYDPSTGTFSVTGSFNDARENHAMVRLPNGTVLVAGGNSYSNTGRIFYWNTAELFQ
jgi:hypothetical protein